QWGLGDAGAPGRRLPAIIAPGQALHRPDGASPGDARAGIPARGRFRRDALSPRLPALPAVAPATEGPPHDAARAARHPGPGAAVPGVSRDAARTDLRCTSPAASLGELASDGLSRPARRSVSI